MGRNAIADCPIPERTYCPTVRNLSTCMVHASNEGSKDIAGTHVLYSGIFQIDVVGVENVGTGTVATVVENIAGQFTNNLSISCEWADYSHNRASISASRRIRTRSLRGKGFNSLPLRHNLGVAIRNRTARNSRAFLMPIWATT